MPESDITPDSPVYPVVRKSDRVDSPSIYESWHDYAFSDDAETPPIPLK